MTPYRSALLTLFAALTWLGTAVRAAEPEPTAEPEEQTPPKDDPYWVNFEAGQVEVDTKLQELELRDHVVVQVDRYRLRSDALKLHRGPRGIHVDGEGFVAFCPCPDPPVEIGFRSASVAPPTDVLIEQPTLRIGGVPVLWLPYLWLRSPRRFGLLPPEIAWRGREGLLAGAGVHIPLESSADDVSAQLDLRAAGYLKGGVRLTGTLATAATSTTLLWDHLDSSLLAVEATGSHSGQTPGTVAFRADAIRGERARAGTVSLEQAARRYDRMVGSVAHASSGGVFGLSVSADAPRGGALDSAGAVGPAFHAGFGTPLGSIGAADTSLTARTMQDADRGPFSVVSHRAELRTDARPGPLALGLALFERADATADEQEGRYAVIAGGRARAGVPLVRAFGAERQLLHWVEPYTELAVMHVEQDEPLLGADASPRFVDDLARSDALIAPGGGLYTSFGDYSAREAMALNLRAAYAGTPKNLQPVAAARFSADSEYVGASSEAVVSLEDRPERTVLTLSRARFGPQDGLNIAGYAEGRELEEPLVVRWVHGGFEAPLVGWFDRSGWTVGGELQVPWTDWLATAVAADWDVVEKEPLAARGALAYRHRCGCLAALAWVGHRLGRDGFDARLSVDLIP